MPTETAPKPHSGGSVSGLVDRLRDQCRVYTHMEAADLIERQNAEIERLARVKEAYRYYIDASDDELADAAMTRSDALKRARELDQ